MPNVKPGALLSRRGRLKSANKPLSGVMTTLDPKVLIADLGQYGVFIGEDIVNQIFFATTPAESPVKTAASGFATPREWQGPGYGWFAGSGSRLADLTGMTQARFLAVHSGGTNGNQLHAKVEWSSTFNSGFAELGNGGPLDIDFTVAAGLADSDWVDIDPNVTHDVVWLRIMTWGDAASLQVSVGYMVVLLR